jgi:hypothetical protein
MQIHNPYASSPQGQWLKGNLHTHSTRSDGNHDIQDVIRMYADAGYDFLMMSDHDVFTTTDDYASLDNCGLALIPGNEITAAGPHILHVDADRLVEPHADRQAVIDDINAGQGFAILNHPNWFAEFNHCPHSNLKAWQGHAGLEIYNGVIGRLEGSPYATDHWDRLLGHGRCAWGYAHDDFHNLEAGDMGLGWNMVKADDRSVEAIVQSLREGNFYPSTGVTIASIQMKDQRIRIEAPHAQRIVALRDTAKRIAVVDDPVIDIEVPEDARYIRFECWGSGEQFAWTQPFRITRDEGHTNHVDG